MRRERSTINDKIIGEYEAARKAFHAAVDRLEASPDPRKALTDVVTGMEEVSRKIACLKEDRGFMNVPSFLTPIMGSLSRIVARANAEHSLETLRQRYDSSHEQLIGILRSIHPHEWDRKGKVFGQSTTITETLSSHLDYIWEDLKGLKR